MAKMKDQLNNMYEIARKRIKEGYIVEWHETAQKRVKVLSIQTPLDWPVEQYRGSVEFMSNTHWGEVATIHRGWRGGYDFRWPSGGFCDDTTPHDAACAMGRVCMVAMTKLEALEKQ